MFNSISSSLGGGVLRHTFLGKGEVAVYSVRHIINAPHASHDAEINSYLVSQGMPNYKFLYFKDGSYVYKFE